MNKCIGCGVKLQTEDESTLGYINPTSDSKLCKRCFRLKNYGEYLTFSSHDYYLDIKKIIRGEEALILHLVDILNIPNEDILETKKNKSILILNKRDIFPKSKNENTILTKLKKYYPGYMDYIIISSINNHNVDNLYNLMLSKNLNKVYVIGYTNSGKSTLINKLIKNYSNKDVDITTSLYPSTTLNTIEIKLNDNITIIDTPGIIKKGSILKKVELSDVKLLTINKEIKPMIFQFKNNAIIKIDKFAHIECNSIGKNSIVIFGSDKLSIEKVYKIDKKEHTNILIDDTKEVVISDLCFIKVSKETDLKIYIDKDVSIYERNKLT